MENPDLKSKGKDQLDIIADLKTIQDFRNMYMLLEQRSPAFAEDVRSDFDIFEKTLYDMSIESEKTKKFFDLLEIERRIPGNKFINYIRNLDEWGGGH